MTEDEAKTKWCPFARTVENGSGHGSHNRVQNPSGKDTRLPVASFCIASACMAWRVRHQWFDNAQQEPEWVDYPPYAFQPGPDQERDDGYCGLAGSPS